MVTACAPTDRSARVIDARPRASSFTAGCATPSTKNVASPEGTNPPGAFALTTPVNVTACPGYDRRADDATVAIVSASRTACVNSAAAPPNVAGPKYRAERTWSPAGIDLTSTLALPAALTGTGAPNRC